MFDETFAQATMRKLRELERQLREKDAEILRLRGQLAEARKDRPRPWTRESPRTNPYSMKVWCATAAAPPRPTGGRGEHG